MEHVYWQKQHGAAPGYFEPMDDREHEAAGEGRDYQGKPSHELQDFCSNCHRPFMSHHNGVCQK